MKLDHQIWLLSNMFNVSNDEAKFQHNLLLINEQVSKPWLSTILQSGGFLGRILGL